MIEFKLVCRITGYGFGRHLLILEQNVHDFIEYLDGLGFDAEISGVQL